EQDGTAILDAFFGPAAAQLPARLREVIVKRAGGNPFYLEEIVRDLIATGVLARDRGEWLCTADAAAVDVPTSIQGILLARVDRLPAAARQLLQEAAVLGPSFEPRVLREVASDRAGCEATLELLSEAGLVEEAPLRPDQGPGLERLFRFDQTLVQEVVYQNLLVRRRTELHGRAGEVLEPHRCPSLSQTGQAALGWRRARAGPRMPRRWAPPPRGHDGPHRAGPPLPGDGTARIPERRQPRGGEVGGARAWPGRAGGKPRRRRRRRRSGGGERHGPRAEYSWCRPRPAGPHRGGGRTHRAERGRRARARSPQRRLSILRQPRRPLRPTRSPAGHRSMSDRPRHGEKDRRLRVPVPALRQPRGRLLRPHRPL